MPPRLAPAAYAGFLLAIPTGLWQQLTEPTARLPTVARDALRFSLDVAPDQSTATVAVAWRRPDGLLQVGLADHRPGVDWVVDRAAELTRRWRSRLVVEQTGTAAFLLGPLQTAGVVVDSVPRRFYAEACATLDAAITAHQLRHDQQPPLDAAVQLARWSSRGEAGERILSRRDPRVSPLVAATLAIHHLTTARKRSGRFIAF